MGGRAVYGPSRATEAQAKADLCQAQAASSEAEFTKAPTQAKQEIRGENRQGARGGQGILGSLGVPCLRLPMEKSSGGRGTQSSLGASGSPGPPTPFLSI